MEKYIKTLEELRRKLEEEIYITQEEWDKYAQTKGYFSSNTIKSHLEVHTWYAVRNKLTTEKREIKINKRLKNARNKIYENILKYGINAEETLKAEKQFDNLVNLYYEKNIDKLKGRYYKKGTTIRENYNKSYEYLKSITNEIGEFPSVKEWDKKAKEMNCLSSTSMQYISGLNWHKLRDKVKTDINLLGFKEIYLLHRKFR